MGCGGGGSGSSSNTAAPSPEKRFAGAPTAKEPLAAAVHRLERALPSGQCRRLAPLLLHSIRRGKGVDAAAPPTAQECNFIRTEITRDLTGFKATSIRQFGPAGFAEGTGDEQGSAERIATLWSLDVDGSWRVVFNMTVREQLGFPPNPGLGTNARAFFVAAQRRQCAAMWRLLNVGSRFVRSSGGDQARFCASVRPAYKEKGNGFADLAKNPDAKPVELGSTRDVGFYGLSLRSGRYMVATLTGRLGGIANDEQRFHGDPSVLELVTVKRP